MQVAFEKGSHHFWSVGKDRSVKYWDGDKVRVRPLLFFKVRMLTGKLSRLPFSPFSLSSFRRWTVTMERSGPLPSPSRASLSFRVRTTDQSECGRRRTSLCVFFSQFFVDWDPYLSGRFHRSFSSRRSVRRKWRGCTTPTWPTRSTGRQPTTRTARPTRLRRPRSPSRRPRRSWPERRSWKLLTLLTTSASLGATLRTPKRDWTLLERRRCRNPT